MRVCVVDDVVKPDGEFDGVWGLEMRFSLVELLEAVGDVFEVVVVTGGLGVCVFDVGINCGGIATGAESEPKVLESVFHGEYGICV